MLPFARLKDKKDGFLMNGEVKIVAEMEVLDVFGNLDVLDESEEAIHPLKKQKINDDGAASTDLVPADWVDVNGFQILSTQADLAKLVFETHPEIALEIRTKSQELRTSYMSALLNLIKLIYRWQGHTEDDMSDAEAGLAYMKSVGFNLGWLENKFSEVKERRMKCARVCEMDQQLRDLKQKFKDLKVQVLSERKEILLGNAPDLFSKVLFEDVGSG